MVQLVASVQRQCTNVRDVPPPTAVPAFGHWADPSRIRNRAAPGGLAAIRATDGPDSRTMAATPWASGEPPEVDFVPYQLRNGRWSTRVEFSPAGRLRPEAEYPGPGVHVVRGTSTTHYYISPAMSDVLRRGELEHVNDYIYAQALCMQQISGILYRLSASPRPQASTRDEAVECGWRWFRRALPPQLRWSDGQDMSRLGFRWVQLQNGIATATLDRDNGHDRESQSNPWHTVSTDTMTAAQKRRRGIPVGEVGLEVTPGASEIDRHPTQQLLRERWDAAPQFPA